MGKLKINMDELATLSAEGWSQERLASHFDVSDFAIRKAQKRSGIDVSGRVPESKVDHEQCVRLYTEGWGTKRLARHYDVSETTIRKHVIRAGVLDSTRQCLPSGLPRRKRRLKSQEFTDATKRACFERDAGICQECHRPVTGGWRAGCYHHIRLCRDGGTAELSNAMLLHTECHNDPAIFRRLHGFDVGHLDNYSSLA